jgi:hypothetical protein
LEPADAEELCRSSENIVSQYNGNVDDGGGLIAETLVELAFRLDRKTGLHTCLRAVIGSLKRISDCDELPEDVRTHCIYGWKLGHACAIINRK